MSNKMPRRRRSSAQEQAAKYDGTIIGNIAAATHEPPADVEAALITLQSAGFDFDDIWEWMREAINDGEKIADMAVKRLGSPN